MCCYCCLLGGHQVPTPPQLAHLGTPELQFTLVDCPGHASLLRTIVTGVQIIDMMMLVIDITKGGHMVPPFLAWTKATAPTSASGRCYQ